MRINYDDDLVIIRNLNTNVVVYAGMEDDDYMKRENWIYNEKKGIYELSIKICGEKVNFTKQKIISL